MIYKYVDMVDGLNTKNGNSPETAWKTLDFAASRIVPGTTVYVKTHDEFNSSVVNLGTTSPGTDLEPIIWTSYPDTRQVIYCKQVVFNSSPGTVIFNGINISNWSCAVGTEDCLIDLANATKVMFNNCCLTNNNNIAGNTDSKIFGNGTNIRCHQCYIQNDSTYGGSTGEISGYAHYLGCCVNTKSNGIHVGGDAGGAVQNCLIIGPGRDISTYYGISGVADEASRKVITNNTIKDFAFGFQYDSGDSPIIMNNIFYRCSYSIYFLSVPDSVFSIRYNVQLESANYHLINYDSGLGDPPRDLLSILTPTGTTLAGNPFNNVAVHNYKPGTTTEAQQTAEAGYPLYVGDTSRIEWIQQNPFLGNGRSSNQSLGCYAVDDWPNRSNVLAGVSYRHGRVSGTLEVPDAEDVRDTVQYGSGYTGVLDVPDAEDVRDGVLYDNESKEGTLDLPAESDVRDGVLYDGETKEGTFVVEGGGDVPAESDVRDGVVYDNESKEGTLDLPAESDVRLNVVYDNETKTGTLTTADRRRNLTFEDNSYAT